MPAVPSSTYRVQLRPGFGFTQVAELADYLSSLGVSHVYLSPIFGAPADSTHGYDVTDPTTLRAEFGGAEGFIAMRRALASHGIGIVLDIVPNHMAIPVPEWWNPFLWSVLRYGKRSPYAAWFDIDWEAGADRLVLPILDGPIDANLDALTTRRDDDHGPVLCYHDHRLPIAPGTEDLDLADLLDAQHYRLVDWRQSALSRNYRRFVDIDGLIAVRVEDPEVFSATHGLLLDLVRRGLVDGLRVDHVDGLHDPGDYLARLDAATGHRWTVVEKILAMDEGLSTEWPVAGTTGYDTLAVVTGLFIDPDGEGALTTMYRELIGVDLDRRATVAEGKRLVATTAFAGELRALARTLASAANCGVDEARAALLDVAAALPVYRPYHNSVDAWAALQATVDQVAATSPAQGEILRTLPHFIQTDSSFAARFGQFTAAVYAKGVEDTAFYRDIRLLAVDEVGYDPRRFAVLPEGFHDFAARLAREHPTSLTTLSTHDTKRSEDVRARLAVLSEIPDRWASTLRPLLERGRHLGCPDAHAGYFFWQTLVGAWPLEAARAKDYLRKALREAKLRTSWQSPDPDYEAAVDAFVDAVYADVASLREVERFVYAIEPWTQANILGQKLLQLAMPGIPDVYQGCERVSRRLVDPDNRAPVDFEAYRGALGDFLEPKLRLTATVLRFRRRHPEWFTGYQPLTVRGPAASHLVGFHREGPVVALVTRLAARLQLGGGWRDTEVELPEGTWVDALNGREYEGGPYPIERLLRDAPVAFLVPSVEVLR
ncbi:MAG: malto-oligosyltrehalose synthase [Acidothermus sp.]|nr:malto-oligosyltrehalose synthase [Acidothermus sp.]